MSRVRSINWPRRFAVLPWVAWLGLMGCAPPHASTEAAPVSSATPLAGWQEDFAGAEPVGWTSPSGASTEEVRAVYAVRADGAARFLHARHDSSGSSPPPAVHWGKAWREAPRPLIESCHLSWRWRALAHAAMPDEPWDDVAVSVYAIMALPGVFRRGRGFKFAWLSRAGPEGTTQRGMVQIAMRSEPASRMWRREQVDLCGLYRKHYGDIDSARLLYVGVVSDADDTSSVVEGDYDDFVLSGSRLALPSSPIEEP